MKRFFSLCILLLLAAAANAKERTFIGSTPAAPLIREFLGIPQKDSIDFIRWKLVIRHDNYDLQCEYGLSKSNTNGFTDRKTVGIVGKLRKENNHYFLTNISKTLPVIEINNNLVHFVDEKDQLLPGNGGYSYALNNIKAAPSDKFNFPHSTPRLKNEMIYEGRTPCQILSNAVGMGRQDPCYKLKWYFIFYTDAATGKPTYYLKNGRKYKRETMGKGTWEIITGKDGRTIYKVNPAAGDNYTLYFVKAGDNILFFTDAGGNLLVGTEDFSFTLNRRTQAYARIEEE